MYPLRDIAFKWIFRECYICSCLALHNAQRHPSFCAHCGSIVPLHIQLVTVLLHQQPKPLSGKPWLTAPTAIESQNGSATKLETAPCNERGEKNNEAVAKHSNNFPLITDNLNVVHYAPDQLPYLFGRS